MKYANLHLHSTYSDGVWTPLELCQKAKEMGYGAIAITDHDNVAAYKELQVAAEQTGMEYLFGMEAAVRDNGVSFHIVGYDFDPTAKDIAEYIHTHYVRNWNKTKAQFDKAFGEGLLSGITWEQVVNDFGTECWICNEQVFATLVKNTEWEESDYWKFRTLFNQKVQFENPVKPIDAETIIRAIRDAGGVASLAHPSRTTHHLPRLYEYGLNCVEYDHPDIDGYDAYEAFKFAKAHKMYLSGGTDHTGLLANHVLERGLPPEFNPAGTLTPHTRDVRMGATKEEFEALKNRIYG